MKTLFAFLALATTAVLATAVEAAAPKVASAPGLAVSHAGSIYVEGKRLTRGAQPAWSPDGKRLAFQRDGQLFVIDVATKKEQRVVRRSPGLHWPAKSPAWSPDGRKLAFSGAFDVHVVDLATRRIVNLTRSPNSWQANVTPSWSPDGRWIAFARNTEPRNSDVFVMRASGGQPPRRLTFTERQGARVADETSPTWSPDGRTIVFASNRGGSADLYAIGVDGSGERRLTSTPGYDEEQPRFSRNGRRILYVHDARVAHMKARGTDVRELGLGAHADWK